MPGERERLSAVLAVRNDAAQIAGAVEGLRFADEVVVVDLGSSDGSPEMASSLGCRVVPARGESGPTARNAGFEGAAGPWILSLEPGERLTAKLKEEIVAILETPAPACAAYSFPFAPYFFGKYLRHGGFRAREVRLFRKERLRCFRVPRGAGRTHPRDGEPAPRVEGEVGELRSLAVRFQHPRIRDFVSWMNASTSEAARPAAAGGRSGRGLVAPAFGVFWSRFVMRAGFRDGTHGFVAAALMAAHGFVESAKVWEALHVPEDVT